MLQIFEIAELTLSPTWMLAAIATVSLRVLGTPSDTFAIRYVNNIYQQADGRIGLGPPFIWRRDWTGRYAGLGFADAEVCAAAAAEVSALVRASCPAIAGGDR